MVCLLKDKVLARAIRRGIRNEDDGWLAWEQRNAREIGLEVAFFESGMSQL